MDDSAERGANPYETVGTVESIADGVARVRMDQSGQCGPCHACAATDRGTMVAETAAIPGLEPGDRVRIALDPRGVWRGTFWTFVLPLTGLLVGALIGYHATWLHRTLRVSADLASGLCGLVLLAATFALGMLRNRRLEAGAACQPRILARL